MLRSIALLIVALALTSLCVASEAADTARGTTGDLQIHTYETPARSAAFLASLGLTQPTAVVVQQACCKICTQGKACGNTCISRDKICHVGPGCACDG